MATTDKKPVLRYVARRLAQAVIVIALAYTAVFFVLNVLPGNPIEQQISNPENPISEEDAQTLRDYYRLDEPVVVQFGISVGRLVQGDLGYSLNSGKSVATLLETALPSTLALASVAFVIAALLGLGIALTAVFAPSRAVREVTRAIPPFFLSIPIFITGLFALQFISFQLGWVSAVRDDGFRSVLLAATTLALPVAAPIAQVLIQGLTNTASQPYTEVLRAKGLRSEHVVFGHLLKNGSIPTLTIAAMTVGELLAGSVITETIFNRTGIGYLTEDAVRNQDTPVIQAVVISVSVTFVLINLFIDLIYPLIDPRISLETNSTKAGSPKAVAA